MLPPETMTAHRRTSGRMGPTGHFNNLAAGACENPVIPAESVRLQIPRVVRQELRGPVTLAILSEVVDIIGKLGRTDVDPEPPLVASPFSPPNTVTGVSSVQITGPFRTSSFSSS